MASSARITSQAAQASLDIIAGIAQGTVDTSGRECGARLQAAQSLFRFWQLQERYLSSPAADRP